MKKRSFLMVVLALIFAMSMILTACGDKDKSGTGGGDTVTESKPITLKVNNFMPQEVPPALGTAEACVKLEELSGGNITTEEYYNGTLLGFDDSWQGTSEGAVDVAMVAIAVIDQNTILNHVFANPIAGLNTDQVKTTQMFNELIDKEPSLNAELETKGLHWLSLQAMANLNLHLSSKVVKTMSDVKGINIEGLGAVSSQYWQSIGASTTTVDPGEYFTSCQKGIIDGMFTHWACVNNYGLNDVLHTHTVFGDFTEEYPSGSGISTGCMGYAVNLDTWNSLSKEQQDWLTEAFRFGALRSAEMDTESNQVGYQKALENGDTIINITGDDLKPWNDAMTKVVDAWIAECDKAGETNAKAVQATLDKLVEEYKTK